MTICGLLVLKRGGSLLYSIYADLEYNIEPNLFGGFLSAIQAFSEHLDLKRSSQIRGIILEGIQIKYRIFNSLTFIGLLDQKTPKKRMDLILEYLIYAFLSKFRRELHQNLAEDITKFRQFDTIFLKYRNSKKKDLQSLLDKLITSKLQGIINKMTNLFPISRLVEINPKLLRIIGNKIIWIDVNIELEEEERIINVLRTETDRIYGSRVFDLIESEVQELLEKENSNLMV